MKKPDKKYSRFILFTALAMVTAAAVLTFPAHAENRIIENKMPRKTAKCFSMNVDTIILRTYSSYLRSNNMYHPKVEALRSTSTSESRAARCTTSMSISKKRRDTV